MSSFFDDDNRERLQDLVGSDYRLRSVAGQGGMSTVWLADDVRRNREVAVKFLRPEYANNPDSLRRFHREAESARQIHSPNVVATYDYREFPDERGRIISFIVMEFIRGESLADRLHRERRLPQEEALTILEQAARGLEAIHALGLVHRDIKPGNLLLTTSGEVKITDFGIAKTRSVANLTQTGMVVGTAQYISPEQAQSHPTNAASDIYSLGAVGYEMLSGQRPFTGDNSTSVAIAHIQQAPPPLPQDIIPPLRELIGICLRKNPAMRYANGEELEMAIAAVRAGKRPPAPRGLPAGDSAAGAGARGGAAAPLVAGTSAPSTAATMAATEHFAPRDPRHPRSAERRAVAAPPPRRRPARRRDGTGFWLGLVAIFLVLIIGGTVFFLLGGMDPRPSAPSSPTSTSSSTTFSTTVEVVKTTVTEEVEPEITEPEDGEYSEVYPEPSEEPTRATRPERPAATREPEPAQPTRQPAPAAPDNPIEEILPPLAPRNPAPGGSGSAGGDAEVDQ